MPSILIKTEISRYVDLGADSKFAGRARRFVRTVLWTWGLSRLADDLEQIAGELVTNALPGGEYRLTLYLNLKTAILRVEVADHREGTPEQRESGPEDENGRGLVIVEALADRWGYLERPDGNTVWAELHVRRGTE
ncbi:ATP-binding protein [Actinoallomurus vinaceus]|uniref:ATP-binding protein n=1 Tax=Actinoallomurus vinaceus TaxID=1080074 RepID=A0ABP8UQ61_9ACTN